MAASEPSPSTPSSHNLRIFVETGPGKKMTLDVNEFDTIQTVKIKIKEKGFPKEMQKLRFLGKQLKDGFTLSDYSIRNKSTLLLDFNQTIDSLEPSTMLNCTNAESFESKHT